MFHFTCYLFLLTISHSVRQFTGLSRQLAGPPAVLGDINHWFPSNTTPHSSIHGHHIPVVNCAMLIHRLIKGYFQVQTQQC